MTILVLYGPNLNLLGLVSRDTGTRLTLDKLNRSLRRKAQELGVELKIYQKQSETAASRLVQQIRNRVDGILLVPGIWARSGQLIHETVTIVGNPLAVFHLEPEPGPWHYADEPLFQETATCQGRGATPEQICEFLEEFFRQIS